ncbi:Signal transduction histidine kinase [Alicyclobacillus macrosporangiidus]|uniref:histidine kinase n=1 Tax=Alicyclobacillus macrosporangiidus TaxID=392015 RepID=A0A1I7HE05_9BACL|nr:Signal transduction histidine kinase [Alicyclobacillus macrosporangiidus]
MFLLVVLYVMWSPLLFGGWSIREATAGICAAYYLALMGIRREQWPAGWRTAIGMACIAAMVGLAIGVHEQSLGMVGLYFLAGVTAVRLRGAWSWILAAAVLAGFLLLIADRSLLGHVPVTAYAGHLIGLAGAYAAGWSVGVRRRARELQEQHLAALERAHRELQEASIQSMQLAVLEEHNRIARDIHDSVGHTLTTLVIQLQALRLRLREDREGAASQLDALVAVARRSLQDVRSAVREMAAEPVTGPQVMTALIRQVERSSGLPISFEWPTDQDDWPQDATAVLHRVLQEALTNVVRHSRAARATVRVERTDHAGSPALRLVVEDDGIARPGAPLEEGFGIQSMRSRCEEAGGRFSWEARSPHGLRIEAVVPWNIASKDAAHECDAACAFGNADPRPHRGRSTPTACGRPAISSANCPGPKCSCSPPSMSPSTCTTASAPAPWVICSRTRRRVR